MSGDANEDALVILISGAIRNLTDALDPDDVRRALGDEAEAAYRTGGLPMLERHVNDRLEIDGYLITSPIVSGVVQLARTGISGLSPASDAQVLDLTETVDPSHPITG